MRVLLVALLFVVGCSGSEPAALPLDTQASYAQLRADVDALQARLDSLRVPGDTSAELTAIRAEVEGLKASMAKIAAPVKVPVLIDDTTGSELGRWTGGACFWSESLTGEVCLGTQFGQFYWASNDCTGIPLVASLPQTSSSRLIVYQGTAYRIPEGSAPSLSPVASQGTKGACSLYNSPDGGMVVALESIGAPVSLPSPTSTHVGYR